MKRSVYICAALCAAMLCGGCSSGQEIETANIKSVSAQQVDVKSVADGLDYIGFVKAKETKNYSFLVAGKVAEINVSKGDSFKKGDVLARLDTTKYEYSASAGSNTAEQAQATLEKTISTYDTNIKAAETGIQTIDTSIDAAKTGIEAMEKGLEATQQNIDAAQNALDTLYSRLTSTRTLHENGIVTDKDMEALEAQYTTQQANLEAAKASYDGTAAELKGKKAELQALYDKRSSAVDTLENLKVSKEKDVKSVQSQLANARINEQVAKDNVNDDAVITAESDGYVMELPFKVGEVTSVGYPVVVAKSKSSIVSIGVPDSEYGRISIGQKALINDDITGVVSLISQYPDEKTRTYTVEIDVDSSKVTMGETVNVKILTGEKQGYYVPISAVFNLDGVDYVYIVNDKNRVIRKQVILGQPEGAEVAVEIDDPEAMIVTDGIKSLNENDEVRVQSEVVENGK